MSTFIVISSEKKGHKVLPVNREWRS